MTAVLDSPIGVVVAHGDLDSASAPDLTAAVEALLADAAFTQIVVDLTDIHFVDLHGLRAVERLAKAGAEIVPGRALLRLRQRLVGFCASSEPAHRPACSPVPT